MSRDRMQRQRFEFKYILPESVALEVRPYAMSHLDVDEAGVGKPNFSYRVNSIYLDSPEYTTFQEWINSNRNRYKLRMRFYDTRPDTPVFLEIKRRVNSCILKQRCGIHKKAAPFIIAGQFPPDNMVYGKEAKQRVALENFITMVAKLRAMPKAMVTYVREAYVDPENDGVRVTLDREVRIAPLQQLEFTLNQPLYVQPFGDKVILELKFNNRYPNWFGDMVRRLRLNRSAAAKYCEGISSLREPQYGNYNSPIYPGPVAKDDPPLPSQEPAPRPASPVLNLAAKPGI